MNPPDEKENDPPVLEYGRPAPISSDEEGLSAVLGIFAAIAAVPLLLGGIAGVIYTLYEHRADRIERLGEIYPTLAIGAVLCLAAIRWCRRGFSEKSRKKPD